MAKKFRQKLVAPVGQFTGKAETINSQSIVVVQRNGAGFVTECYGTVTVTDAGAGYAKGCRYTKTDGGVATTLFINEGSTSSCDFNAMETSASTVTGVTAGDALSGGGTEGTVELDVNVDDATIEINTDALRVKDAGITTAKLAANAATGAKIPNAAIGTLAHLDLAAVSVDHADVSPKEIVAADASNERFALVTLVATEAATGGTDIDVGTANDANSVVDDFGAGAWAVGDRLTRLIRIPAGDNLRATIADAGTAGAFDVQVHLLTPIVQSANIATGAVTNPKVADSAGAAGLFVKKTAHVLYDFSVDGGTAGVIALTGAPTIPDNAVVRLVSYDVLTTVTTEGADAGTLALGFATDGDLTTGLAVSDALNAWDAGPHAAYETALQAGILPVMKKLTAARVPILTVATQNVTAGKIVFELEYWVSA